MPHAVLDEDTRTLVMDVMSELPADPAFTPYLLKKVMRSDASTVTAGKKGCMMWPLGTPLGV
jgi:hypothetical protein